MAAGLGFKTFTTGEVLTAADTNGYLMQGVLVFASSAARAAAITSPQEGQYSYLKDTNSTEYYDGAAWIAAPIGDITGVTAGTGISGGGTSGTVTVTNSMATAIDAKGDLIAGTAADTFDRLAVGTNGQTLVADSSTSTGLKWATPASGGKVLQVVQDTLVTTFTTSSATYVDTGLTVSITPSSATSKIMILVSAPNSYSSNTGSVTHNYSVARVLRDATQLMTQAFGTYNYAASSNPSIWIPVTMMTLDSPATTSAITYKVQAKVGSSASFNIDGSGTDINSIIVMEIGA